MNRDQRAALRIGLLTLSAGVVVTYALYRFLGWQGLVGLAIGGLGDTVLYGAVLVRERFRR